METISSSRNQRVLLWRSLKEKKGREEHGLFLVEGPKLVSEALLSGFSVNALLLRQGYMPPRQAENAEQPGPSPRNPDNLVYFPGAEEEKAPEITGSS